MMKTLVNKLAVAGAASLAALLLSSGGVLGELVISEPVRSVDNIPPEPVTNLLAVDTGVGVRITGSSRLTMPSPSRASEARSCPAGVCRVTGCTVPQTMRPRS